MSSVSPPEGRYAPPWIFGITNLPFGIASGFALVAMPYFLANDLVSGDRWATIAAIIGIPSFIQLLYAPIVDLGFRRHQWLVIMSVLGALCLAASMFIPVPPLQIPFASAEVPMSIVALLFTGQMFCGLVASCNGAIISLTLPAEEKPRAAGWVNVGNLGGATFGGGIIMTLADPGAMQDLAKSDFVVAHPGLLHIVTAFLPYCSLRTGEIALLLMIIGPALAALAIPEPEPEREPLLIHMRAMLTDVWQAVSSRRGWTGLLFCISPVGTMGLLNLFSDMGADFHTSKATVVLLNGYAGGVIQAGSALVAGYIISRVDARVAYLWSGGLTALVALGIALGPLSSVGFITGCVAYMLVAGLAYTAFSAVVYDIVGTAGKTAATLYSVFPAVGNFAIMYCNYLEGRGQAWFGIRGAFWADTILNVLGVVFLLGMLFYLRNLPESGPSERDLVTA